MLAQRHQGFQEHAQAAFALPAHAAAQLGELLQRVGRAGEQRRAAREAEGRKKKARTVFASMSASADAQPRAASRRRGGGAPLLRCVWRRGLAACYLAGGLQLRPV